MGLVTTGSSSTWYAVTTDEAVLHARIDTSADNSAIQMMLKAAETAAEISMNRRIGPCSFSWTFESFSTATDKNDVLTMPRSPVRAATTGSVIAYYDTAGTSQILASTSYRVDNSCEPALIKLRDPHSWPDIVDDRLDAVVITYQSGYAGTIAVPENIKMGILQTFSHWYENREITAQGAVVREIPKTAEWLFNMSKVALAH